MPTKMNFRTDGSYFDPENPDDRPKPQPGDVWRIFWNHQVDGEQVNDQIAGYAICCPKCSNIHHWTSANNCTRTDGGGCIHEKARTSCWTWTGSAEDNALSGTPSLQVTADSCNWHGYLTNGELIGA